MTKLGVLTILYHTEGVLMKYFTKTAAEVANQELEKRRKYVGAGRVGNVLGGLVGMKAGGNLGTIAGMKGGISGMLAGTVVGMAAGTYGGGKLGGRIFGGKKKMRPKREED